MSECEPIHICIVLIYTHMLLDDYFCFIYKIAFSTWYYNNGDFMFYDISVLYIVCFEDSKSSNSKLQMCCVSAKANN